MRARYGRRDNELYARPLYTVTGDLFISNRGRGKKKAPNNSVCALWRSVFCCACKRKKNWKKN